MLLKKKAHNLFSKSIKLALKHVKGTVTAKKEETKVEKEVPEEVVKPKKPTRVKKDNSEEGLA